MLDSSKGKIFLAAERGHTETDVFRSYQTFSFGSYQNENKTPFGPLYVCNDDTLGGGRKIEVQVENDSEIILIPTVGAITYKNSLGSSLSIQAGEALIFDAPKPTFFEIANPYTEELVNFLQIWIKKPPGGRMAKPVFGTFDLPADKNKLLELFPRAADGFSRNETGTRVFMGKFAGRQEITHPLPLPDTGLFVFVLEGAFEVQYRLLESRDGLALWNVNEIEAEALSDDAIMLLIQIPLNGAV